VREKFFEACRRHLVGAAADLHDDLRGAAVESDDERQADESFLACQTDFHALSVAHDGEHRSEAAVDEVDARERFTGFMQDGVGRQLHELELPGGGAQFVGGQAEQDQIQNMIAVAIGAGEAGDDLAR